MNKKYLLGMALGLAATMFVACGDEVTEVNESTGLDSVSLFSELPECTEVNVGKMAFVSDSAKVYYCADGAWTTLNGEDGTDGTDGSDGKNGEDGENGKDGEAGESCDAVVLSDKSGYTIICGGDTVGVVKNGTNGLNGVDGAQGEKGEKGDTGEKGEDGKDGVDGTSCTIVDNNNGTITLTCGEKTVTITSEIVSSSSVTPIGSSSSVASINPQSSSSFSVETPSSSSLLSSSASVSSSSINSSGSTCTSENTYFCTRTLKTTSNNVWKNNPVTYTWTLYSEGCNEITSINWKGDLSGETTSSVTKDYSSAINKPISVSVTEKSGTTKYVPCENAYVVEEKPPVCNISDKKLPINYPVAINPNSIEGCDYTDEGCSYVITKNSTNVITGTSYKGGTLNLFTGESTIGSEVEYTLTLTNYLGNGSCSFNVEYAEATAVTATTDFVSYAPNEIYFVSTSTGYNSIPFGCKSNNFSPIAVGEINGTTIEASQTTSYDYRFTMSPNSIYLFMVYSDAPSDLTCGLLW